MQKIRTAPKRASTRYPRQHSVAAWRAQSHSYQGKELYFELFRYLTGQEIYNGHNGWVDYFTDKSTNLDKDGVGVLGGSYAWDSSIERGRVYDTPFDSPTRSASSNYAINMMFFVANQENDSDKAIEDPAQGLGSRQRTFTDMIRVMNDADLAGGYGNAAPAIDDKQNLTSYFIVPPNQINRTTLSYAQAGGTGVSRWRSATTPMSSCARCKRCSTRS